MAHNNTLSSYISYLKKQIDEQYNDMVAYHLLVAGQDSFRNLWFIQEFLAT